MSQRYCEIKFNALGGQCSIDILESEATDLVIDLSIKEVRRIEKKYSRYISTSIISQINSNAAGAWIDCDDETCSLFDYAEHLYKASNDLFDITSGVLGKIWNFQNPSIPSENQIKKMQSLVDWLKFERRGNAVRFSTKGMQVDLGGYGKEYAVDRVATILLENKISSALINFGGDMRAIGCKLNDLGWSVGIQDPRDLLSCYASIELKSGALATSGDYERFFEIEGQRYCHILNPRTGMPVSYWRSVTVLAPLTIAAGAAATIAMLLEEQGHEYLENSGFGFLATNNQGEIFQNTKKLNNFKLKK
jgi:FAD:protein FMN transferase